MSIRVGMVGPGAEDDFAANILAGLDELGVKAVSLGEPVPPVPGRRLRAVTQAIRRDPRLGPLIEKGIVRRARENEIDLVITVVSLRPETVRKLRSTGTRVVLWFPDHVANLGALWMFDAPYDALFFKEPALVRRLNALLELPIHYLPQGCNPRIHHPVASAEATGKVAVVGNLYPTRARLLERLASDGVPLAIYGAPEHASLYQSLRPFHAGRYLRGLNKSAVFGSAAAVLNSLYPAEIEGMNSRLFEAAGAGGTVVSEHRPDLETFFKLGDEVLAFRSYTELLDALHSVLDNHAFGRRLGAAASRRALVEHSYAARLRRLFNLVA